MACMGRAHLSRCATLWRRRQEQWVGQFRRSTRCRSSWLLPSAGVTNLTQGGLLAVKLFLCSLLGAIMLATRRALLPKAARKKAGDSASRPNPGTAWYTLELSTCTVPVNNI